MPTESEMYRQKQEGMKDYQADLKPNEEEDKIDEPIFEISNDANAPENIIEKARSIIRSRYNIEDDVQLAGVVPAEGNKYLLVINVNKGSVGTKTIQEKFRL